MKDKIFIIILNWNGGKDTIECLNSVLNIDYDNFQIILVDNGSNDGIVDYVKNEFPSIIVLEANENLGFVEGNNVGIRYALADNTDYIFLLNNDTIVSQNILNELLVVIKKSKDIAVVTPKILNYYDKDVIESVGGILSLNYSKNIAIGYGQKDNGQYDHDKEVNFVSGCAFFARADIFKKVGLFDKKYFAYYEDMDICWKLVKQGYKLYYAYKAKVWHKVSAATGGYKSPNAIYWSTRNRFIFVKSCGSKRNIVFFIIYFIFIYFLFFILSNIFSGKRERIRAFIFAILSLFSKRFTYNKDFPYKIALDISPISKSKAGVGYYTSQLMHGLHNSVSRNIFTFFRYDISNVISFKILNIIFRLLWEQIVLPFKFLIKGVKLVHFPAFVCPIVKTSKYVITIHDMAYLLYPEMFVKVYRFYLKFFVPLSAKRADLIIADSQNTQKDIIKFLGINSKKIRVIYPGINSYYKLLEDKKKCEKTLKKFGVKNNYILTVGTLEPRKNIKGLVEAFSILCSNKDFKASLVIVGGKGWYYEELFEKIDYLKLQDRVIFTGYASEEEILHFYNMADLFVYPSFYEGFGLPLLEAMVCGCPVLASNVSSIPEVVGDAGHLVDPYNINDIADGILKVLSNEELKGRMISLGLERSKLFSWEKCVNETKKIYDEFILERS